MAVLSHPAVGANYVTSWRSAVWLMAWSWVAEMMAQGEAQGAFGAASNGDHPQGSLKASLWAHSNGLTF